MPTLETLSGVEHCEELEFVFAAELPKAW